MNKLWTQQEWFDRLIPEGLTIPASIMLSGPAGSGKPLIGNVMVASWLRQGGSVVFMSLQYPDHQFIITGLKNVSQLDLDDYSDKVAFIELDATLDGMTEPVGNRFKANVVIPSVWDQALQKACSMVPNEGPGIMIFASAINLLLFSPTYEQELMKKLKLAFQENTKYTYLFSASTTAKAERIAELEAIADHLIITRSEKSPFRLFMEFKRVKDGQFLPEEVRVPLADDVLADTKAIAEHSRKRIIPIISKI